MSQGRSADAWVDFNFYGHQIVCHEVKGFNAIATANAVDGDPVPVPHSATRARGIATRASAKRRRAARTPPSQNVTEMHG